MAYTAADIAWNGNKGVALNGQIYYDFLPYIAIDGVTFRYDRQDRDDDHWVTALYYKSDDGREVVAYQKGPEKVC